MAINKNHEFEELDGVKCAIVEKNASQERIDFLKSLLELNKYTVMIVASSPPKVAPVAQVVKNENGEAVEEVKPESSDPPPPTTFTIGVTDVRFNATNAIFGRMLKTETGEIVTLAYWQQRETVSHEDIPYFAKS